MIATVFVGVVPVMGGAASTRAGDGWRSSDPAITDYADYFAVDFATAARDVALTDEASRLQVLLSDTYPEEFAGLWIEHAPGFKLVVAMTTPHDADVMAKAGPLAPFVESRLHRRSLADLSDTQSAIVLPGIKGSTSVDVKANQVAVSVLAADRDAAAGAMSDSIASGAARVAVVPHLPTPVADSYGGLSLNSTCGGLQGTAGWTVMNNATGTFGILTAGHLANCLSLNNVNLTYVAGAVAGNIDAQWHSTPGINDVPKFRVNDDGGTRWVTAFKGHATIVNGQVMCKYGRTTLYGCGTVDGLNVDPDGFFGPLNSVFVSVQKCAGPSIAEPGDSGGPVFYSTTGYGHITHKDSDAFCSFKMLFNSVSESGGALNLSFAVH